jgi:uncharacterized membrane protein
LSGPPQTTIPPTRVHGVRRGITRLALAAIAGLLTAFSLWRCSVPGLNHVAGWNVAALVFAGLGWLRIVTMDAEVTRRRAAAEDPGRTFVWLVVLAASAFSLFAAIVVLRNARHSGTGMQGFTVGMCLLAVAMAWILTHTSYSLRYAHLYYRDDAEGVGGLDFPGQHPPCYFDFAYFAFTVGMCFQVSDVVVSSPQIRRTVLGQAILAFIYNTTIMALVLNLVFSMFSWS